jgi:hypothetical protein
MRVFEGAPARDGAMTMWQSGQVLAEQSWWLWQTIPTVIVSTAAMSTIGTTTRHNLVLPGMQEGHFRKVGMLVN